MNPNIPENCNGCGKPLLLENLYVCDGCPCNSVLTEALEQVLVDIHSTHPRGLQAEMDACAKMVAEVLALDKDRPLADVLAERDSALAHATAIRRAAALQVADATERAEKAHAALALALTRQAETRTGLETLLAGLGEHSSLLMVRERVTAILRGEARPEQHSRATCAGCGAAVESLMRHAVDGCPGTKRGEAPVILQSLSDAELALAEPISEAALEEALERGRREVAAVRGEPSQGTHPPAAGQCPACRCPVEAHHPTGHADCAGAPLCTCRRTFP